MGEAKTKARNGAHVPEDPPHLVVARRVYETCFEDGDKPWDELEAEQAEDITDYVRMIIVEHIRFLVERGFKVVPPGAAPIPQTQDEAMAMLQAAKGFFDGQKRQGKLMATAARPKFLVPPGVKH